jgi:hypothetical protein
MEHQQRTLVVVCVWLLPATEKEYNTSDATFVEEEVDRTATTTQRHTHNK